MADNLYSTKSPHMLHVHVPCHGHADHDCCVKQPSAWQMTVKLQERHVYFECTVSSCAWFWEAPSLLGYMPLAVMAIIPYHPPARLHAQTLESSLLESITCGHNMAPRHMYGSDQTGNRWCWVKRQTGNTVHSPPAFSIGFTNFHSDWSNERAGGGSIPRSALQPHCADHSYVQC
jgi:hypothetical protein